MHTAETVRLVRSSTGTFPGAQFDVAAGTQLSSDLSAAVVSHDAFKYSLMLH